MTAMRAMPAFLREMLASAIAQRVFTLVTVLVVAGSTMTILMTSGRSAAAEAAILSRIDAQGTRTIVVQSKGGATDVSSALVDRIAALPLVESVVGLGRVLDATAAAIPAGPKVGVRMVYGSIGGRRLWQPDDLPAGPVVFTSRASAATAGLSASAGTLRLIDGREYTVAGELPVPDFLKQLEPLAVIPPSRSAVIEPITLSTIIVLAAAPEDVAFLSSLVRGYLVDVPRDDISVSTSEEMASLRRAISGELTRQGRAVVIGVLGAATAATLVNVSGFVLMRRKDFGRRRALGATRLAMVVLVVGQVLLTAAVASVIGVMGGVGWAIAQSSPRPPTVYVLAVATALTLTAAVAAAIPAAVAARRDPLRELRVP